MAAGTDTTEHAAEHAGGLPFDPGGEIFHHILDAEYWEVPFTHLKVPFPQIHLFGLDLSITKHVAAMWVGGLLLFLLLRIAASGARNPVPSGLRNAFELFVVFIRDEVARKSIPHVGDRYVGYLLTTFFFILTCNLLGMIPGSATATGNVSVTAGLALAAFVVIQWGGIRQYGIIKHTKNLVPHGLPIWLTPIIALIEVLSQFIRPFALCIRLFANMMAGHVVIGAFIMLTFIMSATFGALVGWIVAPAAVAFALFVHLLEMVVAFLQAYIFTMLTATFIGMSVHPSH